MPPTRLTTVDHSRDASGFTYVYPVVSRRAGGVSVGVNLNPNNACNWRCIYCQVPNLVHGAGPELDLGRLEDELSQQLEDILHGEFMKTRVPPDAQRLSDVAFSGNGEPTSSPQFEEAVARVGKVLSRHELIGTIKVVLITNGSLMHRASVRNGISRLARLGGEIWFKIDALTRERALLLNNNAPTREHIRRNLALAAQRCTTRIQSCVLALDGAPPPEVEVEAFLAFLRQLKRERIPLRDVMLYGPRRASMQPEANRISELDPTWVRTYAERIRKTGTAVEVHT
ncbi:MAG: radical SAM protein [Nannocystaceae bacterium]